MSVNCDPLFLQIEQNDMNEAWLEEDYGSVFSVFDIDDFVTGIKITIYASVSLVTLIWTCLSCYIRGQIKRQNVALSIKNTRTLNSSLETTTTKPPQSEQTTQNNANKEGITQHIVALLCVYLSVVTLLVIAYIPGYFVGAHIADSYDSYVEVGCIAHNCTQNRKYDNGVMYEDYNISSCYNCVEEHAKYDGCVLWQFDMESLCQNTSYDHENAQFYGTFVSPNVHHWDDQICFINRDSFKVRSGGIGCGCNTRYCCTRCGLCVCRQECCPCCSMCSCWNLCGYCVLISSILFVLWLCVAFILMASFYVHDN
eukprot:156991_1